MNASANSAPYCASWKKPGKIQMVGGIYDPETARVRFL